MNARPLIRTLGLATGLLLAGCQMTTFEQSPVAATGCDPALAGHWLSTGDEPGEDGEMVLRIDAQCRLEVDEHKQGEVHTGAATTFKVGRHGAHRYAWVDGAWLSTRFEEEHQPPAGDVYVLRYAVDGDRLQLWSTNEKPIAHAIIDGELKGEVVYRDNSLFNRLVGEQPASVLERADFFDDEPGQFRREAAKP